MSRRSVMERATVFTAKVGDVFSFFASPENLGRITPPGMKFRILAGPGRTLREQDRIQYSIRVFGLPMHWTTRITMWREGEVFADLQERGPYRYWLHTHTFRQLGDLVEMKDHVEYELPFGFLGNLFGGWLVRRQLAAIFDYRGAVVRRLFGGEPAARAASE